MPAHRITGAPLDFVALRRDLGVPGSFPDEVVAAAEDAARNVELPDLDRTDIPFVTVDPPGSRDLDQALHIARDGDGYLVSYAIADVAAFVSPDGVIDVEARRRGETLYFPDARVPLHPAQLSEGAASLLPDQVRPAVLWQIGLSNDGSVRTTSVRRARVRSRAQLDYGSLQRMIDSGEAPDAATLLAEVGPKRLALARTRHAINLDLPEQEVEQDGDSWRLAFRTQLPVESWNAEISLLTGMCAAQVMLTHGIGVLRTLPDPDERAIRRMRRLAPALGVTWPDGSAPGDVLSGLDRSNPRHIAFIEQAATLLRGAGYTVFADGPPPLTSHAGVGAPYAHVTAPLRRLVDRFGSSLCAALDAGEEPPAWVRSALPDLPDQMARGDRLAHTVDRAVVDMTEAWLLQDRVGDEFAAVVVDADEDQARIQIDDPPVRAKCKGAQLADGDQLQVRLTRAEVATRIVEFIRV
jgi:VacB/RNase II family 3'-5' exoribonuclease